jgi:hypothetical protein
MNIPTATPTQAGWRLIRLYIDLRRQHAEHDTEPVASIRPKPVGEQIKILRRQRRVEDGETAADRHCKAAAHKQRGERDQHFDEACYTGAPALHPNLLAPGIQKAG